MGSLVRKVVARARARRRCGERRAGCDAVREGHRRLALAGHDPVAAGRGRRLHVRVRQGDRGHDAHRPDLRDQPRGRRVGSGCASARTTSAARRAPATPRIIANAIAQADYFLDVAQPQAGELPPVLDLETKGGLAAAGARRRGRSAWLDQVAARTGVHALVYASPNFWKTALGDTADVADAGTRSGSRTGRRTRAPLVPAANWGGHGWTFWQYTSHGTRARASRTQVDVDRFRGADASVAAIRALPDRAAAPRRAVRRSSARRRPARRSRRCRAPGAAASRVAFALPVAALRRRRRGLRADRRRDRRDVPAGDRRRRSRARRRRDRAERRPERRRRSSPPTPRGRRARARRSRARRRRRAPTVTGTPQAGQTLTLVGRHAGRGVADARSPTSGGAARAAGDAVRRDRRRDGVDVHADARRHRRDDLARRDGDRHAAARPRRPRRRRPRSPRRRCRPPVAGSAVAQCRRGRRGRRRPTAARP